MKEKLTRGQRNHNPLNIRRTKKKRLPFVGECFIMDDPEFLQFTEDFYGYRAAFKILHTYYYKHNRRTLRQIITRWAPPKENDTKHYIATVAQKCMIDPDEEVNGHLIDIVKTMALIESNSKPSWVMLSEAYKCVFEEKGGVPAKKSL